MTDVLIRKGSDTRERIMDVAEAAILEKGFAATSIDEIIAAVDITKSGFFYHFKDKAELAKALLVRYTERENQLFDDLFARAEELNEDPLHGFLVALRMLAEMMANLPVAHPGCLVASFCYQEQLFNQDVRDLNRQATLGWRSRFTRQLERITEVYPPRIPVRVDDLADMILAVIDGALILSKTVADPQALARQVMLYRDFVRLIFLGTDGRNL